MLSNLPINLGRVDRKHIDREILRAGMIAELDAVNFYEQMAAMTADKHIRNVLFDIAKEEKTHLGEFQALLLARDNEQFKELKKGEKETGKLRG